MKKLTENQVYTLRKLAEGETLVFTGNMHAVNPFYWWRNARTCRGAKGLYKLGLIELQGRQGVISAAGREAIQ